MIGLTYVVASLSYRLFEIRWLRLKRFFNPAAPVVDTVIDKNH